MFPETPLQSGCAGVATQCRDAQQYPISVGIVFRRLQLGEFDSPMSFVPKSTLRRENAVEGFSWDFV